MCHNKDKNSTLAFISRNSSFNKFSLNRNQHLLEVIKVSDPKEYLEKIEIGRDGLIVQQGMFKGLLLPQVPVEQGWEKDEFLSHTCMKAGLMPDAWFNENTRISKFSGQIFTEIEPRGKIEEKKLDGSHC